LADEKNESSSRQNDLDGLSTRLEDARKEQDKKRPGPMTETSSWGMASRFVGDLVSGMIVGGCIGWFLDQVLDTKPWMLIIFLVFGIAAGIMNVMRSAKELNEAAQMRENEEKSD